MRIAAKRRGGTCAADPDQVDDDEQLVILVRPNNPDGGVVGRDALLTLARRLHGKGGHLIVDEAFCGSRR
ncbi:MAG: aminotransferase class I/II-fold pyridoxal phosphate-dependent enzyme [Nitratireductor sp.]